MNSINKISCETSLDRSNFKISLNERKAGDLWIVCLHGLQTNKDLFQNLILKNSFNAYSFLAVDFLGFGDSGKPEDFNYSVENQARIIIQLIERFKLKSFHIIGHSLGGMIGTLLLDLIPEKIISLTSLEGNLRYEDCGSSADIETLEFETFKKQFFPELKKNLKASSQLSAALRSVALDKIPDYVFYQSAKSIVKWSRSDRLYKIWSESKTPKLLIKGACSSFKTNPSDSLYNKTAVVENASHFMLLDHFERTAQFISDFLN